MTLHIRNVSKTYPNSVQALKDVTLTIPAGMYGLLEALLRQTNLWDVRKQKLGGYSKWHEATLRRRRGASGQSEAAHRRRAYRRARSRGARSLS